MQLQLGMETKPEGLNPKIGSGYIAALRHNLGPGPVVSTCQVLIIALSGGGGRTELPLPSALHSTLPPRRTLLCASKASSATPREHMLVAALLAKAGVVSPTCLYW